MLVEIRAGDELQHVVGGAHPLLDGLLAQDRDTGLEVGRLHVGEQAPLEPAAHPLLEPAEQLGRQVAGDDDLLVGVVQRVEGVEELLLRLHLALQELDVVDEQDVDVAVAALEVRRLVVADAVDEVVGELLGVHVAHPHVRVEVARVVADRVEQVGLAQPGLAVDEQRVVRLGRRLGDGDGGRVGEPVARADDEGVEGVLGVQPGRRLLAARDQRLVPREPLRSAGAATACPRADTGRDTGDIDRSWAKPMTAGSPMTPVVSSARCGSSRARIDGDGELHRGADLGGQRLGHLVADPGLHDVLGVVVGHLDQRGSIEQAGEPGQGEEGPLPCGETVGVEGGDGVLPDLSEVQIGVTHWSHIPFDGVSACCPAAGSCFVHLYPHAYPQPVGARGRRGGTLTTRTGGQQPKRRKILARAAKYPESRCGVSSSVQCLGRCYGAYRGSGMPGRGAGLTLWLALAYRWRRPVGRFRMPVMLRLPSSIGAGFRLRPIRPPTSTHQATRA